MNLKDKIAFQWPPSVPCLPLLILFCISSMPFVLNYFFETSLLFTCPPAATLTATIIYSVSNRTVAIVVSVSAILITAIAVHPAEGQIKLHDGRSRSYEEFRGIVKNVHYPTELLEWTVDNNRSLIQLTEVKKNGVWQPCSGMVNTRSDLKLQYGELIEAEGAFFEYDNDKSPFSYEQYLKLNKITFNLQIDKLHSRSPAAGIDKFFENLYSFRDQIIKKITSGLKKEKDARLLASMFFGYKGLLSHEEKEVFQGSGTIHLFAVSGLHIGIAAALIVLLLKIFNLDDRLKWILLVISLGFYVLMTGAPSSAVRAFVMISVWQTARLFRLPSNGLNNIAVSALILLIFNPLQLLSAGFLYTFIITAVLVAGYRRSLEMYQVINEHKLWKGNSGWDSPWMMKLFLVFMCSLWASIAAFGLNIIVNQRVIPFSMLTNMFTGLLAFLSFLMAFLSLSGLQLFYTLQGTVLDIIGFTAKAGEFSWTTASKSVIAVILFYIALTFFMINSKKKTKSLTGISALLIIIFAGMPYSGSSCTVRVNASSNVPTLEINHCSRTYLINCSTMPDSRKIDCLILTDLKADHMRKLVDTLNRCQVRKLLILEKETPYFKRLLQECRVPEDKETPDCLIVNFLENKDGYDFDLKDESGDNKLVMKISKTDLAATRINLNFIDKSRTSQHSLKIPFSNNRKVFKITPSF